MEKKRPVFLRARWEDLVMFNYEVDPLILSPHLPRYTLLDLYNGKALVSVIGFMFTNTKVFGIKWPYHTNFEEVNLRFYVKHFDGTTWKRGVVFVSEIVPSPAIAFFANFLYREHYHSAKMRHDKKLGGEKFALQYEWQNNKRWNKMEVTADSSLTPILAGSEQEFILEHYWGYNKYNENVTIEYGVEHLTWQVHKVETSFLDCDVRNLYGDAFVPYINAKPHSVFLAKGSDVIVRKPKFIRQ